MNDNISQEATQFVADIEKIKVVLDRLIFDYAGKFGADQLHVFVQLHEAKRRLISAANAVVGADRSGQ